ncbi:unnamed protein product, partial [Mesorhabditis spiculigera]
MPPTTRLPMYASYFANDRFIWKLVWRWFETGGKPLKKSRHSYKTCIWIVCNVVLKCNCKASVVAATVFDRATEQFCLAQKIIPRQARQRMQCKNCYLLYKWFNEVGDALSDAVSRLSTTFWAKDMTVGPGKNSRWQCVTSMRVQKP